MLAELPDPLLYLYATLAAIFGWMMAPRISLRFHIDKASRDFRLVEFALTLSFNTHDKSYKKVELVVYTTLKYCK
jgi:hypothetical protein